VTGGPVRPIAHFDPEWGARVAEFCARAYAEHTAMAPSSVGQPGYALAADAALDCGLVTCALGAAPGDVRVWVARAAQALGEVFRLRGTAPGLQSIVVTGQDGDLQAMASSSVDDSLTNSSRGLLGMYTALVAGDRDLAERTASLVDDPPDPPSSGPPSEAGTTAERQLAGALKALLLGQDATAVFRAGGPAGAPPSIGAQGAALRALVSRDRPVFLDALRKLLAAHAEEAGDERNAREPRLLMSLPGLGLSALALALGLLEPDQLPAGDVYLPLEIIRPLHEASDGELPA